MADTDYGTAELNTEGPHEVARLLTELHPAAILGTNTSNLGEKGLLWDVRVSQGHALTFGATRSGKGVSAIIPALLTYGGSMVVIDPKGENCFTSSPRRLAMGQRVVTLDPWGEVNRRYGQGRDVQPVTLFNPLSAINPDSPDFNDEVAAIADALVIAETGNESHWTDSARELIAGLVAAVIEMNPGKASLGDVRQLLALPSDELAKIIKEIAESRPGSLGERKLRRFAKDGREVDSIRSTALTQTAVLDSGTLRAAMETDSEPFDLAELATGWVTLYLVLPLDRLQSHGRWLRLILTLAIRAIARQAEPPAVPVMFLLDEFGTIGRLSMIEQAFGLMAGIGIRVWAFLQDLNQLKRDYPQSWETFIANCAVMQVLNARDTTTSNYFSDYVGTTTMVKMSRADEALEKVYGAGSSVNRRETGRPVLFPEELRRMGSSRVLVFLIGIGAFIQRRVTYHGTPEFAGLYRPLPAFVQKAKAIGPKEAVAILERAGFKVTAPGLRSQGWKVRWHSEPEKTYTREEDFLAFALKIRDEQHPS